MSTVIWAKLYQLIIDSRIENQIFRKKQRFRMCSRLINSPISFFQNKQVLNLTSSSMKAMIINKHNSNNSKIIYKQTNNSMISKKYILNINNSKIQFNNNRKIKRVLWIIFKIMICLIWMSNCKMISIK